MCRIPGGDVPGQQPPPQGRRIAHAALLLAATREPVAEAGNEVALDEIARRAGVGNATLYRHFPTSADLLVKSF